ncbi:hypothetical protein MSHO_26010 [Mycobacterium shottsii]|uniref:Uncharacterized protein n=1 Tax=Mycobacterium shottsii TaxID=133549 RepID=A0A7I7LB25_9MYCO|nr:hypothetical protein MSHO_26010 [Mycobacterium shottsii]
MAITHHNATTLTTQLDLDIPTAAVWSQWHSYAFDVSVWEILGALLSGGRVVVVPENIVTSPEDFHALLIDEHVSVLTHTPSALAQLPDHGLEATTVITVGESCPIDLAHHLATGHTLLNAYGPTETTMCTTISNPLHPAKTVVPIGAPVPGAGVFVLDSWLRPVPPIQTLRTGTGTPLFCIHATSGISWPYQTLANHLTNPLIGINQTLNTDETPPHTLQAMARNYATRIQNTHPTGPYHLLDWSYGGVLAHQIAIELHHRGHTDTRLILLDSLPTLDTNTNPTTTPRNDRQTLQTLLGHHHTTIPDDQLHHLTTNHNNNITLYQHHQPHTYSGPTLLIAAEHTPPPNHPTYESTHTKAAYLLHAWQPHLTGPTTTHSTNCTHHQLLHPNHTPTYTNHLKNLLQ